MVSDLAFQFALEMDNVDEQEVVVRSLYHDLEEAATGDIPRWAKRQTDELQEALDDAEEEMVRHITEPLSDAAQERTMEIWRTSKSDGTPEAEVVAAADIIAAVKGAAIELEMGNRKLAYDSDIFRGIKDAKEICSDVPPAAEYLEELLDHMREHDDLPEFE